MTTNTYVISSINILESLVEYKQRWNDFCISKLLDIIERYYYMGSGKLLKVKSIFLGYKVPLFLFSPSPPPFFLLSPFYGTNIVTLTIYN